MAGPLLLDTDLVVEYLRGRPKAIEYVEGVDEDVLLSVISMAELFAGVRDVEQPALRRFFQAFAVLPVTQSIAELGGSYRRQFGGSHGTGLADALIAATAVDSEATLVTFNQRHFPMLKTVVVPYKR